ncbi:MAG: T9SS type A sorting domain-containing protein, partial [Bacteroidetes bacterium]|nr:T9SS type A sorting domain-containing protein [Bacteroidota bacterium]
FNQTIVNYLNSSGEIYIHVPKAINVKQVYLINLLGQIVKSWNITNTPNISNNEFKIPVKNISEGNYIIRVETNRRTINKMVIITQ